MFTEIGIKETVDLLLYAGAFVSDHTMLAPLVLYPKYYNIQTAYQFAFSGDFPDLNERLRKSHLPPVPSDGLATIVFETTEEYTVPQLRAIQEWAIHSVGEYLARFEPVFLYGENQPFTARITVIYHDARQKRAFYSHILHQRRYQELMDGRIAKMVDGEMKRNREIGASPASDESSISRVLSGRHFLWAGIANSNSSASDVFRKLRIEMDREKKDFDVQELLLFMEADKAFTIQRELALLKQRFAFHIGMDVPVYANIRRNDSYIKYITCRAVLVGKQKYASGEICEDYGQHEVLLYESPDSDCGHLTVAYVDEEEFTLSRYDWGVMVYDDRIGRKETHYYFDKENTKKLFARLHVKKTDTLLKTVRRRFAAENSGNADALFLEYCRKEGIDYGQTGYSIY